MWQGNWRDKIWGQLDQPWDIIVIGGGITGAGILREASRLGLRILLVEQRDFSWGTSSRSSKLVHGGLRYLEEGKPLLARVLVRERNHLLSEGHGLIEPLGFLLPTYKGDFPRRWIYAFGLLIYDLLELKWKHKYYSALDFQMLAPHIAREGLRGGYSYRDAETDDARLVLRVIHEAVADGGIAMSYVTTEELICENGQVVGVRLRDGVENRTAEARARVVINATGTWADHLRAQVGGQARIRPLRGSHLIFTNWRLPVAQAVSILHPVDRRHIYILPWEGVTVVGTTDIDHDRPLDDEPSISPEEVAYLMAGLETLFPSLGLTLNDVVSTFAGVRAVIGTGKAKPSEESREHAVWEENGLLTVTGGKLTNFRLIALDALKAVQHRLPTMPALNRDVPVLNAVNVDLSDAYHLDETIRHRLLGRYAAATPAIVEEAEPGDLKPIPGTQALWAELRWAARNEGVVHLEDLLLRRVRVGVLLPQGGAMLLPQIRNICQSELGWDDPRWEEEEAAYLELCRKCYSLPDPATIPDWRTMVAEAKAKHKGLKLFRRR